MKVTQTERLTHDAIAACGRITLHGSDVWEADDLPDSHAARMELFLREIREAAGLATMKRDDDVAAALFSWLAYHRDVGPGGLFAGLAARAAFGYRHRNL